MCFGLEVGHVISRFVLHVLGIVVQVSGSGFGGSRVKIIWHSGTGTVDSDKTKQI